MATPYEIIKAENAQLHARLAQREEQLQKAKAVHEIYKQEKQQTQDLLFACLHTLGPHIHIEIDNFHKYFANAQFDGALYLNDEGRYVVRLQFYQEGIEEYWRRQLYIKEQSNEHTIIGRLKHYAQSLVDGASPEEAYTLAITNYP